MTKKGVVTVAIIGSNNVTIRCRNGDESMEFRVELSAAARCVAENDLVRWDDETKVLWTPKDRKGRTLGMGDNPILRFPGDVMKDISVKPEVPCKFEPFQRTKNV